MGISKLDKSTMQAYFDRVSKAMVGSPVSIEIDSLSMGCQIAATEAALTGIVYDPRSDMLAVIVDGLDHMIRKPESVYLDETDGTLTSMQVQDGEQVRHLITVHRPATRNG